MSWNRREFLGRSMMGVGLACLPLTSAGAEGLAALKPSATAAPGMERWLLETGRPHLDVHVYDLVSNRLR